jgi:hypothetical protein
MFLQDIGEDVLLEILCLCDMYLCCPFSPPITDHRQPMGTDMTHACFIAQANKFFRRVALSKQLWLH